MIIRMDIYRHITIEPGAYSGATADVFEFNGQVYKVFRVYGVARIPEQVKSLFESECEAYRRATAHVWLRHHAASFYGACIIEDILDGNGNSVGDKYALDCCYQIELLVGDESKFCAIGPHQSFEHLQEAERRFRLEGIDVSDSSVFNQQDAQLFKFIDFRMKSW